MTDPNSIPSGQDSDGGNRPHELPLEFRGCAREYFRIWSVNLCLTLLTLGIFSAWAKVRKKRYFYAHIRLDGTPFQYLGQPVPILKGRVMAATLFSLYYASTHFFTSLLPYVLAAGLLLAPWVVVRSAAFNARYSAFRNMTLRLDANYADALKAVYAWGMIPILVVGTVFEWWGNYYAAAAAYGAFGFAFPWWLMRLKRFLVGRTSFGGLNGGLSATGWQLFKVYFLGGLILAGAGLGAGLTMAGLFSSGRVTEASVVLTSLPVYAAYVLSFAYIQARSGNLVWNRAQLGPLRFRSTLRGRDLAKLYLTNALAIVASAGMLIPWAVMRTLKYRAENMHVLLEGDLTDFVGGDTSAVRAAGAEVGEFFGLDLSL